MEKIRPQFYCNTLQPAEIRKDNLELILKELQLAVKNSVNIINKNYRRPADANAYGNIYSGVPGIILTLLRLERQKWCLQANDTQAINDIYSQIAFDLFMPTPTANIDIEDGRMSPLASATGPAFMRILAACEDINLKLGKGFAASADDFALLNKAVEKATLHEHVISFKEHRLGSDEILFGRAGLLWALLTIQRHCLTESARELITTQLKPAMQCIPQLVDAIITGGKNGSQDFVQLFGEKDAMPLMYQWMEGYYVLGAVHGTTGILTMLFECKLNDDQLQLVAETITGLCRVCIEQNGHFPMSIPERPAHPSKTSPFVQLCHGPPGLLILLSTVYQNTSFVERFWRPEWDNALRLATDKIWQEGLISKGGNLCHGLTGNIWPLLSLHNIYEYNGSILQQAKQKRVAAIETSEGKAELLTLDRDPLDGNYFLSRALTFMMLARETPPYSQEVDIKVTFDFRCPDRPYCFGEGLSGQVCAWAETCAVIKALLRKMELESNYHKSSLDQDNQLIELSSQQLGMFGFEVNGPRMTVLPGGSLCQEKDC